MQPCTPGQVSFGNGVHGCILTLIYKIGAATGFVGPGLSIELTDDFKIKISHATSNVGITANKGSRILGFTADIAESAVTVTAPQRPLYCWFPAFQSGDDMGWYKDPKDTFKGAYGGNGGAQGVTLPASYERSFRYSTDPTANVWQTWETDYYTISGTDYNPNEERSFLTVMRGARDADNVYTQSGNINPKGIYYIHRAYEYTGTSPTRAIPSSMDAGGINFHVTTLSKRDNYAFCQVMNIGRPGQTVQNSATHFECSFTLATDETPDTIAWNG